MRSKSTPKPVCNVNHAVSMTPRQAPDSLTMQMQGRSPVQTILEMRGKSSSQLGIPPFDWVAGYDGYDKEVEYLIDGLLPAESFGVVYGASGAFKSFLAFSWGLHIATGKDWSSHKVTQKSVLYVVAEGGIGAPRRIKAWSDEYNDGEQPRGFYRIDIPAHMANYEQRLKLESTVDDIQRETGGEIGLIVIDTLARCFAGADENSTKDMNDFIAGCDNVKAKTKATILVVHHSGKNEDKGGRGSSALRAACDFEYKVKRPKDGSTKLILSCEKMKDDEPINTRSYSLGTKFLHTNEHGREINSLYLIDEAEDLSDDFSEFKEAGGGASAHQGFLWTRIKQRTEAGVSTNIEALRDEYKNKFDTKHFRRTVEDLTKRKMIVSKDDKLYCTNVDKQ